MKTKEKEVVVEVYFDEEDLPHCPMCESIITPIYENVGFTAPDPEKIIFTGYECENCGYAET